MNKERKALMFISPEFIHNFLKFPDEWSIIDISFNKQNSTIEIIVKDGSNILPRVKEGELIPIVQPQYIQTHNGSNVKISYLSIIKREEVKRTIQIIHLDKEGKNE